MNKWKEKYEEKIKEWEDDIIDVRNLIVYIEFLEALSKYPENDKLVPALQNQTQIEELFEKLKDIE